MFQQTAKTFDFVICTLRVNTCEVSVYMVRTFMKWTHVSVAQKAYWLFTKLYINPDFPSLADEIAKPHPDMNIKLAAFTVSEKSNNTYNCMNQL